MEKKKKTRKKHANMFYRFIEFKRKKLESAKKKKKRNYCYYNVTIFLLSQFLRLNDFETTDFSIKRLINVKTISTRKNIYNTKKRKKIARKLTQQNQ